jgi:hypothetical protein
LLVEEQVEVEIGSAGGGGAGGFRTSTCFSVCGNTTYPITVGSGGGAGAPSTSKCSSKSFNQYFQQLHQQVVEHGWVWSFNDLLEQEDQVEVEDLVQAKYFRRSRKYTTSKSTTRK